MVLTRFYLRSSGVIRMYENGCGMIGYIAHLETVMMNGVRNYGWDNPNSFNMVMWI